MPELPEVELVARSLRSMVTGRTIIAVELLRERLAPEKSPADFAEKLINATILHIGRRGKHILFELSNKRTLIVHLRMSGRFMLMNPERENPKFTHAIFYLEDDLRLVFQDQRHFGFMKIVETINIGETKELKRLAPEPFSDEFSSGYLRDVLRRSKRNLKQLLLDQSKVLGLGNIYASEALFLARANPRLAAYRLGPRKTRLLFEKIREVLGDSIAHGSTLIVDPENIDGSFYGGGFEERWHVYDRENEPCVKCRTPIRRIVQGGRSTYFCPRCQR